MSWPWSSYVSAAHVVHLTGGKKGGCCDAGEGKGNTGMVGPECVLNMAATKKRSIAPSLWVWYP